MPAGVLFGASYRLNPDAGLLGAAAAVAVEAGGMLTAAYIATRSLWLPMSPHFGRHFTEACLFSAEVSGNGTSEGLLDVGMSGPALLAGGGSGPREACARCCAACW
ncbi:hypothetical protein IPZ68_31365 [Streptomyces arenae]|nr:hypothetical protein [Streptomyces arenae]